MEKKSTKRSVSKKAEVKKAAVDPFAETVREAAPKKARVKKMPIVAEPPVKAAAKPARQRRAAAKDPLEVITDAFSELVTAEPEKKAKTAKAAATAVVKKPRTVKKTDTVATDKPATRKKAAKAIEIVEMVETATVRKRTPRTTAAAVATSPFQAPIEIVDITSELAATEPKVELSPVFKALADVKLPELARETRARLLMQSPTKVYFYWGLKGNPWQQLKRVFGDDLGSYTLVLKLKELNSGSEEIHPCDAAGNWWFSVKPEGRYQAEIGFYAPNRPYFRVLYSNTIETPRCTPSSHPASEARWTVSATKFAEVLDVAGFSRDAFDVAMAGDDPVGFEDATYEAFRQFAGDTKKDLELDGFTPEELRDALLALASGSTLEELRWRVSASLFAVLQSRSSNVSAEGAREALTTHFDIDDEEWTEHETGPAVFGASLVNFPKTLKKRKLSSGQRGRYNPVSSFSLR